MKFYQRILLLLLFCLLLNPTHAKGDVHESSEAIYIPRMEKLTSLLPGLPFSIPATLTSDSDVYVLILAGGAFYDIRVLGRPSVPPQRLAHALDSALQQAGIASKSVEWSNDEGYSTARYHTSRARFGQRGQSISLPLGSIVRGLQMNGLTPYGSVRLPYHASVSPTTKSEYRGENYLWVSAGKGTEAEVLTFSAWMPAPAYALVLFLTFGTGIAGSLSLLILFLLARSKALTFEHKKRVAQRLAHVPVMIVCITSAIIGFFWMSSPWAAETADLWLGEWMRANTAVFLLPTAATMMTFAIFGHILQARLLPVAQTEEERAIALKTQPERELKKRILNYTLIPFALSVILILINPLPQKHPLYKAWSMACLTLSFAGSRGVRWIYCKDLQSVEEELSDASLEQQVVRIGREAGYPVRLVRVGVSATARQQISIEATHNGKVVVSQKSLEALTSPELDFAIAYAIATSREQRKALWQSLLLAIPYSFLTTALAFGGIPLPINMRLILTFVLLIGMIPLVWFFAHRQQKTQEYRTLYIALRATMNSATAYNTLQIIRQINSLSDDNQVVQEKSLARTNAAFQRAASDLGLLFPQ